MPGIATSLSTSKFELFAFSGYADVTGGSEDALELDCPVQGTGSADTQDQENWIEYAIEEMVVGPHWRRIDGVCPIVVIGGHSQVSPDVADAMGFRVSGVTNIDTVQVSGASRIRLSVGVLVRGGLDGQILTLVYQVRAWGHLSVPMGTEGFCLEGQRLRMATSGRRNSPLGRRPGQPAQERTCTRGIHVSRLK